MTYSDPNTNPQRENEPEPIQPPVGAGPAQPISFDADTPAPGSAEFNSNYQRFAETAGQQMNDAADAIRRGEFITDSVVDTSADNDDRLVSLLCYVVPVLLPVIVMLSESSQKRPFQRYHAVQSLGLSGFMVVLGIVLSIATAILQIIPAVGTLVGALMFCLSPILFLMAVVAAFYYGFQAYQGKRFAIPVVTNFLVNQGWL